MLTENLQNELLTIGANNFYTKENYYLSFRVDNSLFNFVSITESKCKTKYRIIFKRFRSNLCTAERLCENVSKNDLLNIIRKTLHILDTL